MKFLNPKLQCVSTTNRCMSMPLSFFMWSINGQTRVISGMKKRDASMRNLYIVKKINESLNISSLQIFLPFINTCLIFSWQKVGKKIKTVAWTHCFSRTVFSYWILQSHVMFTLHLMAVNKSQGQSIIILQVPVVLTLFKRNNCLWPVNFENSKLWNYKEEFCALHAFANGLWKRLLSAAFCGLVEKMRTPVLFFTNRPFKRQKYSFLDIQIVYQSNCRAPHTVTAKGDFLGQRDLFNTQCNENRGLNCKIKRKTKDMQQCTGNDKEINRNNNSKRKINLHCYGTVARRDRHSV